MTFQRTFQRLLATWPCNPLSTNPTKWLNTLEQFVGKLPTNCLSVFDHFAFCGMALKWFVAKLETVLVLIWLTITLVFESKGQKLALHILNGLMLLNIPQGSMCGLYMLIFLSMIFSYLLKNLICAILLKITHCSLMKIISQYFKMFNDAFIESRHI